jgi:hypothetical protein
MFPPALSEPSPSSSPVYPSHYSWPSSRCWESSGSCITLGHDVGEHRRSREGTPDQTHGTSEVGIAPDHGVAARYVAVCFTPFRHRPRRLSLGSRHFLAEVVLVVTSIGLAFYTCIAVAATVYSDCPFQTPFSILLPKDPAVGEGFYHARSCLVEAKGHPAPIPDRICDRARLPEDLRQTCAQDLHRRGEHSERRRRGPAQQRPSRDTFEPRILEERSTFHFPLPEDTIAVSAGFWLLENSTDFSAASAVAAAFSEFQWPSATSLHDRVDSTP